MQCGLLGFSNEGRVEFERVQPARPSGPHTVEILYAGGSYLLLTNKRQEQRWLLAEINRFLQSVARPEPRTEPQIVTQKGFAADNSLEQLAKGVTPRLLAFEDLFDLRQIIHVWLASSGVDEQILHQAANEIFDVVLDDELLKLRISAKLFPPRECPGGINRTGFAHPRPLDLTIQFIPGVTFVLHISPAAAEVKVLEGETQWVHALVADGTFGILLMLLQ